MFWEQTKHVLFDCLCWCLIVALRLEGAGANCSVFSPRLHIDGYGYGCAFGYGDRKRQDFEILGKGTRTHTGYVSYRVWVRVQVRDLEEVPMLHEILQDPCYMKFKSFFMRPILWVR